MLTRLDYFGNVQLQELIYPVWKNLRQDLKLARIDLLFFIVGNANGDFKFKSFLIYHSENHPSAMKGYSKNLLPVHWRANQISWMTSSLFQNWGLTCAIPEIKAYCYKENLNFKALVLVENAAGHPVIEQSENTKFVFWPPNTTAVIQSMDSGVISTFKSYYLRRRFKFLLRKNDGQDNTAMLEFW